MAVERCDECGAEVTARDAGKCPRCGARQEQQAEPPPALGVAVRDGATVGDKAGG